MLKSIEPEYLHIGTNEDLKEFDEKTSKQKELLQKFPPIFHIDQKTHIQKIAKKGTDLSKHLESLPDQNTDCVAPSTKVSLDCSGYTMGSMKTVVDLEKLASFFN